MAKQSSRDLTIFHKLMLWFIGIAFILTILSGSLHYLFTKNIIAKSFNNQIKNNLDSSISYFDKTYSANINSVLKFLEKTKSISKFINEDDKTKAFFLKNDIEKLFLEFTKDKNNNFQSISFINSDGMETIKVEGRTKSKNYHSVNNYSSDESENQAFLRLFDKLKSSSTKSIFSEEPVKISDQYVFLTGISFPNPHLGGFGGILVIKTSLNEFLNYLEEIKISGNSLVWVTDSSNNLLLSPPGADIEKLPEILNINNSHTIAADCKLGDDNRSLLKVVFNTTEKILSSELQGAIQLTFFIVIGNIFLALVISFFVSKHFSKPLVTLAKITQAVSNGDLTTKIDIQQKGEIGKLSEALLTMEKRFIEIIGKIKNVTGSISVTTGKILGDTQIAIEGTQKQVSSVQHTAMSVEEMNNSMNKIMSNTSLLSKTSVESSSFANQMSSSIKEVANNSKSLLSSIEETTELIFQITSSIKETTQSTGILSNIAHNTNDSVANINKALQDIGNKAKKSSVLSKQVTVDAELYGMASINKNINSMVDIKETISETSKVINRLGTRSQRIGKVITVIDEVTKQTELLALNAAILAAQAGEHGKGFSVVAEEIKNLANRTDASTKEISGIIGDVQKETTEAIESIKNGSLSIEVGMKVSYETSDALTKILKSSKKAVDMSISIEELTSINTGEIKMLTNSIEQINNMSSEIFNATNKQTSAANQMIDTAEKMEKISKQVSGSTIEQTKSSQQITSTVESVTHRVEDISDSIRQQKLESDNIKQEIKVISNISHEADIFLSNMLQELDSLNHLADNLKSEVNRFTLE